MTQIDFDNSTALSSAKLMTHIREAVTGWAAGRVAVRVRYSRGADFSGTCVYSDGRIYINLGRHLEYPYLMNTNLGRAKTIGRYWFRPIYTLELRSGYEVVLFVFMHEFYHLLVKRARRNIRQKESMCDRFAARYLVDGFGAVVRDERRDLVPREVWDFKDLEGFVAAARTRRAARRPIVQGTRRASTESEQQLLLFPV